MNHALVIGGTGMLSDVSIWLLNQGYHVSVIARKSNRMRELIDRTRFKSHLTPIFVDYHNDAELQKELKTTIKKNGNIDKVITWIHSTAPNALKTITNEISFSKDKWELFHVLGSQANLHKLKKEIILPDDCSYYQIQLGSVTEDGRSRWLTNDEISNGVIKAIKERSKITTVGQINSLE